MMGGLGVGGWYGLWILVMGTTAYGQDSDSSRCPTLTFTYRMTYYNHKCYQFYYGGKTWKLAKDYCIQNGGKLAMVDSRDTQTFLKNELNSMSWNAEKIWIGLHDMDDELTWQWTGKPGESDVPATWTNWHEEHPAGWFHKYRDCVLMQKDDGAWTWHEAMCNVYPWEYRFICEYEFGDESDNDPNVADEIYQSFGPTTKRPTTHDIATSNILTSIKHKSTLADDWTLTQDERRRLFNSENHRRGDLGGLSGEYPNVAESSEKKEGHVPLYAVIIAFGAGVIVTVLIILFIVLRRRKRKQHSEAYPSVVYHSHPAVDASAGGSALVGAVAAAPVCGVTGKSCKMAVNLGKEKCVCGEEHGCYVPGNRQSASHNIYVSVGDATTPDGAVAADLESSGASASAFSSIKDISSLNEEPPTYDEAIAGIERANSQTERPENVYTYEPHNPDTQNVSQIRESHQSQGAIPKTPKRGPTETYLPMNGSPKLPGHSRQDHEDSGNQYIPMSLGELPPIPTDQGYEIPVSSKLEPEAVKSLRSPVEEGQSDKNGPMSIYSEIPDRNSRIYKNEEQIYSTID